MVSCFQSVALPLLQSAFLVLTPAENYTYTLIQTITIILRGMMELLQECANLKVSAGGHLAWMGGTHNDSHKRFQDKTHLPYSNKLCLAGFLFLPRRLG